MTNNIVPRYPKNFFGTRIMLLFFFSEVSYLRSITSKLSYDFFSKKAFCAMISLASCSLVIVHASLKNMVSRKTRLKFLVPKTASNMTWPKNSWLPQFFEFRPEILHAYFWMHMQSNNDEKKYRFFDPFTGEAPLKYIFNSLVFFRFFYIAYEAKNKKVPGFTLLSLMYLSFINISSLSSTITITSVTDETLRPPDFLIVFHLACFRYLTVRGFSVYHKSFSWQWLIRVRDSHSTKTKNKVRERFAE